MPSVDPFSTTMISSSAVSCSPSVSRVPPSTAEPLRVGTTTLSRTVDSGRASAGSARELSRLRSEARTCDGMEVRDHTRPPSAMATRMLSAAVSSE